MPAMTRSIVAAMTVVVVAAACTGSSGLPPAPGPPHQGGTAVIGLISDPPCFDWYAVCGGARGILGIQTLPAPLEFVDGQYRATPLLVGEPTVDPGPPQRVTYRINQRAVWSDGTAITSSDFTYSWEQAKVANFGSTTDIAAIDDSDPHTAVVTWAAPSANWRDRFRFILPRHLLEGKDRSAEMKDGYSFSGGPWMLDHWTRGQEIKLVRNPRYWGKPANLDAVVFRILGDSVAQRLAYKTGQVDDIFVVTADSAELKTLADTAFVPTASSGYSFFAFNVQKAPLDRKAVRQALAYAIDRDAIVTQLQGQLLSNPRPTQALMSAALRDWYSEPFARYHRDLAKVADLMRGDGWAKGPDGVWAQGDVRARVELSITAGLPFMALVAEIVESQWRDAGFDATTKPVAGAALGGDLVPKGSFQVVYTGVNYPTDPGLCFLVCSKRIPTEATAFQGGNISRISSPVLDDIWGRADTELDQARRRDLVQRGQEAVAEELPALPLASTVDISVSRSTKLGGPLASTPPYVTLSEWFCTSTCG
jgi:peptide/nickel transport system substrate-binding protein